MKFLITGGLGFIGSKIIEKLTNDGHSVICVDNEDTHVMLCPSLESFSIILDPMNPSPPVIRYFILVLLLHICW